MGSLPPFAAHTHDDRVAVVVEAQRVDDACRCGRAALDLALIEPQALGQIRGDLQRENTRIVIAALGPFRNVRRHGPIERLCECVPVVHSGIIACHSAR